MENTTKTMENKRKYEFEKLFKKLYISWVGDMDSLIIHCHKMTDNKVN